MNDVDLVVLIASNLETVLAAQGLADVVVTQEYQPTTQGRVSGPTLYFFEVADQRYGWQGRSNIYDPGTQTATTEERQWIRSTFQVMGLAPSDPTNLALITPKDLTRRAAMLVQSQAFRLALRAAGVGMERITDIRSPKFVNDRGQFEASPSFDFTVTRQERIIQVSQAVEAVEFNQTRV